MASKSREEFLTLKLLVFKGYNGMQELSRWHIVFFGAVSALFLAVYPFDESYLAPVLILLFIGIYNFKRISFSWSKELVWPVLLGFLISLPLLISLFFAVDKESTLNDIVRFSFLGIVSAVFVWHFQFNFNPMRWLQVFFGFILFWVFDALLQYFTGTNLLGNPMSSGRLTGLWYPNIIVGTAVAHCAPIFLEVIRRYALKGGWHMLAWLLVLPMIAVVLLGGSRASWVAFVVAMSLYSVYLLWIRAVTFRWLVVVAVCCAFIIFIIYLLFPEFKARLDGMLLLFTWDYELMNRATSGRLPVWTAAWYTFLENPWVGVGSNAVKEYSASRGFEGMHFRYAHMYVLDVLSMTGLIGFLGYSIFYGILLKHAWQALRNRWDLTAVVFICALVMAFPFNTHFGFYNFRPVGLMWAFIALAYAFRFNEISNARMVKDGA